MWCSHYVFVFVFFFFFKQKTAYEMRISDWSSDVCSSDLRIEETAGVDEHHVGAGIVGRQAVAVGTQFGQDAFAVDQRLGAAEQIGRASCRERVCQYV